MEAEVKPLFYLISVFNIMLILLYLTIIFLQILNKKREYYRGLVLVKKGDFLGSLSIVCSNQNSKIKNIIAYKYTVMSDIEIKYDNYYTIIIKKYLLFPVVTSFVLMEDTSWVKENLNQDDDD